MKKICVVKWSRQIILAVVLLFCLAGCTPSPGEGQGQVQDASNRITIYCHNSSILQSYAETVEKLVPEADIRWVVGQNDLDYYRFLDEQGELPDIITTRRFSLNDSEMLKDSLMDLSETEVAASYNTAYLENYRYSDGSIMWLPVSGEVDGIIANLKLFEDNQIAVPTDYESFLAACEQFTALGIRPFVSDFVYDYTCMQTLQGWSINELMSLEGIAWRIQYESKETNQLDDTVWPGMFARMEEMIDVFGLSESDLTVDNKMAIEEFKNGRCAMMRETGTGLNTLIANHMEDIVLLPYFTGSEGDNWLLTYPSFQYAVNKRVAGSESKRALVLRILEAMCSQEAQEVLSTRQFGASMISYNKNVALSLSASMDNLQEYKDMNHLFIRLASNDFFRISQDVVSRMITGELDAQAAYEEFNRQLSESEITPQETVATLETAYDSSFDPNGGNRAASAMANTLRQYYDVDLLIAPGFIFSGSLYAAEYTENQLKYCFMPNSPTGYYKELTGAEVFEMASGSVKGTGATVPIFTEETLPVSAGFEMKIKDNGDGYELLEVTIDGKPMEDEKTYTFMYVHNGSQLTHLMEGCFGAGYMDTFTPTGVAAQAAWSEYITAGNQPLAPTEYIELVTHE